ncbi:MAG: hypothetical protein ACRDZN_15800, partial [Acidimicrobiales bacterium]
VASVGELTTPTLEFVVVNPHGSAEPLRLTAEVGADLAGANGDVRDELAARVRAAVREALGVEADVEVVDRETLPRSGYKLTRVVDA